MEIDDLVVGKIYWDTWMNQPVTVTDKTPGRNGAIAARRHYKNGAWEHGILHAEDLRAITEKRLAAFGLEQENRPGCG